MAELPPIAVRVSEHRLHRVCCPACAAVTTAEPPAVSRWAFGPRLQAAVVTLAVRNRVSRRDTTELARELFGVELSTGTVDAIVQRAGEALAAPQPGWSSEIKRPPVVNIDETGWKTAGGDRTLWGALTSRSNGDTEQFAHVFANGRRSEPDFRLFRSRSVVGDEEEPRAARSSGSTARIGSFGCDVTSRRATNPHRTWRLEFDSEQEFRVKSGLGWG